MRLTGSEALRWAEAHSEDVMMEGSALCLSLEEFREYYAALLAEGHDPGVWVDTERDWYQCPWCGAMYSEDRGHPKPWHRCPDGRVRKGGLAARNRSDYEP